jgi:hypothetical protein
MSEEIKSPMQAAEQTQGCAQKSNDQNSIAQTRDAHGFEIHAPESRLTLRAYPAKDSSE